MDFIAERETETDEETRLREALNRKCNEALKVLDAALRLQGKTGRVSHQRARAKNLLHDFGMMAMGAYHLSRVEESQIIRHNSRDDDNMRPQGGRHA